VWLSPFANSTCYAISALCFLVGLGFPIHVEVRPERTSLRRYIFGFVVWSTRPLRSVHASFDADPFSGEHCFFIGGDEFHIPWWGLPEPTMKAQAAKFNAAVRAVQDSRVAG
jgi:hypothetical protein